MNVNRLKISFLILFATFCSVSESVAQNDKEHIEVALRMIGHQLLLNSGNKSSRVLPIETDGGKYRIRFASEFQFVPGELNATIDSVFRATRIAERYRVEVENVDSSAIAYSYEVTSANNIIPCALRINPKARYDVLISLLDENGVIIPAKIDRIASVSTDLAIKKPTNALWLVVVILIVLVVLFGVVIYIWRLRKRQTDNSNKIMIGKYQFDEHNMKLVYKNDSIDLTSKETDLLMLLHSSLNKTLEREKILKEVWGDEGDYIGRTLDVFISKLRKKFSEDVNVKIVNIRGVGYKLMLSEMQSKNA